MNTKAKRTIPTRVRSVINIIIYGVLIVCQLLFLELVELFLQIGFFFANLASDFVNLSLYKLFELFIVKLLYIHAFFSAASPCSIPFSSIPAKPSSTTRSLSLSGCITP